MQTHLQRARSIFLGVLDRPGDARGAYLAEACGPDVALREQVDLLLEAHDAGGGGMLDGLTRVGAATVAQAPRERPGVVIAGRYKLLEAIAEGGMGAVWVAEQTEPVRRKVALKLIKPGMDSKSVLARFEAERQALAVMDHPNIAKVLDGGLTDAGRPYFVMEYVKGVPITEYCDSLRLDVAARLDLFAQVCQAVQHAHQKGIIHRDLKPSNILVAPYDDRPVPKVIDFGLAKAMHQPLTERTLHTAHEAVLGTPLYMSPEQAQLNNVDVDTRSDVYSLGVLLYELLTGTTPLEKQRFKEAAWDEVRRIIREEEPPRPSTRLSTAEALPSLAAGRQVEPARLTRLVRGELDWIVMKALEKERNRRYESASGLASDVRRYLAGEPVLAAPPSARYRVGKFARKHRAGLAAASVIAASLVVGVAVSTWQAVRATHAEAAARTAQQAATARAEGERLARLDAQGQKTIAEQAAAAAKAANEQAQKRLAQVKRANELLGSIFANLDPAEIAKQARPLQAILVDKFDKAIEQLEGEAIGDPLVVAETQVTFARSLLGLGEPRKAAVLLERARKTRAEKLGAAHPDALMAANYLAMAYVGTGRNAEAVALLEDATKEWQAAGSTPSPDLLTLANTLSQAYLLSDRRELALPILEQVVQVSERVLGPRNIGTLTAMNNLGIAYLHGDDLARAVPLLERSMELSKEVLGPTHPQTLVGMSNLAGAYDETGQLPRAATMYEGALRALRSALGEEHIDVLTTSYMLAVTYVKAGRGAEAVALAEPALGRLTAKFGPAHDHTLACADTLGRAYLVAGRHADAVRVLEQTLATRVRAQGAAHPDTVTTTHWLAGAQQAAGAVEKAMGLYERVLAARQAAMGPAHAATLAVTADLAALCRDRGDLARSTALYEQALKAMTEKYGLDAVDPQGIVIALARNYTESGRAADAAPLFERGRRLAARQAASAEAARLEAYALGGEVRKALDLSAERLRAARAESPIAVILHAGQLATLSRVLLGRGQYADAELILRACLAIREEAQRDDWLTFNTRSALGGALLGQKKYDEAEPLLVEGYNGMEARRAAIPPQAMPRMTEAIERLVELYDSRKGEGDAARAANYRVVLKAHLAATSQPATQPAK